MRCGRPARLGPLCHDDIHVRPDQLGRERRQAIGLSFGIAKLEDDIPAFDPAQTHEPLLQFSDSTLIFRIARRESLENADPPHAVGLLRVRRERPYDRRAADKPDELAPSHCLPRGSGPGTERLKLAYWKGVV